MIYYFAKIVYSHFTLAAKYAIMIAANNSCIDVKGGEDMEVMEMPTDMQYKDSLRKDKFLNDLIIETLKNGNTEKALEYLEKDNERIEKALEE